MAIAVKLWVFTLGAIGAIECAAPGRVTAVALYLLFVIVLGLVFGVWFLLKALQGLGVL